MENKIINYISETPENTNPAVLNTLLGDLNKQSDWNQNDETQPDYVKNRPFYEETSEVVMLPETSFLVKEFNGIFQGIIGPFPYVPFVVEVGKDYNVTLDGVTNTYTAIDYDRMTIITNTSGEDVNNGNGWYINYIEEGSAVILEFFSLDATFCGTHTISISRSVHELHKIDSKFIPAVGKEDMPLYVLESSKKLAASENGTALEPDELAELLKTKHCYIIKTAGSESYMEILSYTVSYHNNVAVYVKCCYILPSSDTILFTKNGTPPVG